MKKTKLPTLLVISLVCIMLVSLFLYILDGINQGSLNNFDHTLQQYLTIGENSIWHSVFFVITKLGSKITLIPGSILLITWLWIRNKDYPGIIMFLIGVAGGDQLNKWIKALVERERPSINKAIDALGYSFPSGHAMIGIIFYMLIAYFVTSGLKGGVVKKLVWSTAALLVLLIGVSRVVLLAHFPSDVIAGYALGSVVIILCLLLYKKWTAPIKNTT